MKHVKHFLLLAALLLGSLTASAHNFVKNGIYYIFNNNDVSDPTVAVSCMGSSSGEYKNEYTGHVSIPSTVTHWGKTYRVTEIYDGAFRDCDKLTSIYIPSSVTKISSWLPFSGCSNLTAVHISSIEAWCKIDFGENPLKYAHNLYLNGKLVTKLVIPEGVTSIGEDAFWGCSGLTSVTIPSSVTRIEDDAFVGCSSLEEIIFKDGSTTLSLGDNYNLGDGCQGLFYDCPLKKVYLGRNLSYGTSQSEGFSPFYNKETLESLTIGNGVPKIGANAFSGCSSLTSITIPKGVASIGYAAFRGCSRVTSVTIPESVTSIGEWAFEDCSSLTTITIPESVTNIGKDAFKGCNFTSVKCPERFFDMFEIYTTVGDFVFREGSVPCLVEYKGNNREVVLPKDFKGKKYVIGKNAFRNVSIVIPEGVTSIGQYAFQGCRGITAITIPEGVTSIGDYAFQSCTSLTSITIPKGVASIGFRVFKGCSRLTSVTIPESVTSIGEWAFEDCSSLTTITIPESVTRIGSYAFRGCSSLTTITIPEGVTSIGDEAFRGCSSLTSITIPEGVTSIGEYAFYGCSRLTSVTIPSSVTRIEDDAFVGCSSLEEIIFKDGSTTLSLGDNYNLGDGCQGLFYDCPLKKVYLGRNLSYGTSQSEGFSPFYNKKTLESLTIGNGVTEIGANAFSGCSGLTSITIPASVTSIGYEAFSNCLNLTSVIAHKSWKKMFKERAYYFDGCNKLEKIAYVK